MMRKRTTTEGARNDEGSILILSLVFSTALALIVVGLATYASATLRLGQVAERSSDRLASANGAMDSALEDIGRGVGPCKNFGQDYTVTDSVNSMQATVDCDWVGGRFNVGDLFAVVMTGAGGQTDELLTITNAANTEKIFEGPVYLASTPTDSGTDPTLAIGADLTIKNADLMYSAQAGLDCGSALPSLPAPPRLAITPVGYGTQCYEEPWSDPAMFGAFAPAEPGINSSSFPDRSSVTPAPDALGCHVWEPGRYTVPPQTLNGGYNYFRSGDYYLDGIGDWAVKNAFVLFGYPGDSGPGIPGINSGGPDTDPEDIIATNPCRDAWRADSNRSGATVYFGGNSQLTVLEKGAVEFSGRERSGQNIAVQALESAGRASTIRGDARLIQTESGKNKQLSIQGLVWAPYAGLEFDLITNTAVAALTGGAVVSELSAGASANTNNFLIKVDTRPRTKVLNLTTTAVSEGNQGSTSVKAVVTVQVDKGATSYALQSRRVVGLTPETSAPPPASPTPGPCNGTTSWTNDFGAGDWTAEYWNLSAFSTAAPLGDPFSGSPVVSKQVSKIDDYLGTNSPQSGDVNADHYAARFTRTIDVGTPCSFTLRAGADDGFRVFVDGVPLITSWTNHAHTTLMATTPVLTAGTHTIVMEYFERDGNSSYELERQS